MAFNNRMNKKNDRVHYSNKGDRQHSFGRGHHADSSDRTEDHRKDDRQSRFASTGANREGSERYTGYRNNRSERTDDQRRTERFEERSGFKPRDSENRRGGFARPRAPAFADRGERDSFKQEFEVTCAKCGKRTTVPFKPTSGKPVLCRDCFREEGGSEGRNARDDTRAPRFERSSRSSSNETRAPKFADRQQSRRDQPRSFERRDFGRDRESSGTGLRSGGAFAETSLQGVFEFKGNIYTRNAIPGQIVYGEKLFTWDGVEYRQWDPMRSKLGAGIKKGISQIGIKPGCTILYLGCSTGTTVSHVSEIVGAEGVVYALDVAPRVLRDMTLLAKTRHNIYPIIADANRPTTFAHAVPQVDVIFMDIAQSNQVEIFLKNVHAFLKPGGFALLSLKSRSVDITKTPQEIYNDTRKALEREVTIVEYKTLDPFEKDHALFVCKK